MYFASWMPIPNLRPRLKDRLSVAVGRGRIQMRIGIPKEIKTHEYRVAITPVGVHE